MNSWRYNAYLQKIENAPPTAPCSQSFGCWIMLISNKQKHFLKNWIFVLLDYVGTIQKIKALLCIPFIGEIHCCLWKEVNFSECLFLPFSALQLAKISFLRLGFSESLFFCNILPHFLYFLSIVKFPLVLGALTSFWNNRLKKCGGSSSASFLMRLWVHVNQFGVNRRSIKFRFTCKIICLPKPS